MDKTVYAAIQLDGVENTGSNGMTVPASRIITGNCVVGYRNGSTRGGIWRYMPPFFETMSRTIIQRGPSIAPAGMFHVVCKDCGVSQTGYGHMVMKKTKVGDRKLVLCPNCRKDSLDIKRCRVEVLDTKPESGTVSLFSGPYAKEAHDAFVAFASQGGNPPMPTPRLWAGYYGKAPEVDLQGLSSEDKDLIKQAKTRRNATLIPYEFAAPFHTKEAAATKPYSMAFLILNFPAFTGSTTVSELAGEHFTPYARRFFPCPERRY